MILLDIYLYISSFSKTVRNSVLFTKLIARTKLLQATISDEVVSTHIEGKKLSRYRSRMKLTPPQINSHLPSITLTSTEGINPSLTLLLEVSCFLRVFFESLHETLEMSPTKS